MTVTIRHFTPDDVPLRSDLMREANVQANLTDFAAVTEEDALQASQLRTITEEHDTKRIFAACRPDGTVIGFWWMTSIDWRSQSCELSFALLPRFRGAWGLPLIEAAQAYLHGELNMVVVIDQVHEHNVMLHSGTRLAELCRVRSPYDQYTAGRWCTALFWTRTADEFWSEDQVIAQHRAERAERIRAELARSHENGDRSP